VHLPLTAALPRISGQLAIRSGRLWVVNQDNDTVSVFNTADNQKLAEVVVGVAPRALAFAPDGDAWVTNRATSNITVIDPATFTVRRTIPLPYGSQPYGLVFAPDGSAAFVALEAAGRVIKLDPASASRSVVPLSADSAAPLVDSQWRAAVRVSIRHAAPAWRGHEDRRHRDVTQTGTQFHGGEVLALDPATLGTTNVVVLRHTDDMDFENQGSGIPNYLGPVVISPDGSSAWVPSKKDNVKRGVYREAGNLNVANTVRAISSRIDLATNTETFGARVDHDNASMASAAAFDRYGVYMFVALETSREVAVVNVHDSDEIFRINVGRAPQGLAVSDDGYRLYVSNFMDRSIEVFDLTALIDNGQWNVPRLAILDPVDVEKLSPTVLIGKQLFYDARDSRLAREGYMSCASCHNDGGGDGRVWDLTGMGEGLRNTISLRGKGGMAHGSCTGAPTSTRCRILRVRSGLSAAGPACCPMSYSTRARVSCRWVTRRPGSARSSTRWRRISLRSTRLRQPASGDERIAHRRRAGRPRDLQAQGCAQCHGGNNFTSSGAAR
jgi:YVTN family beta-propeller protein